jgi:hypothetical protein
MGDRPVARSLPTQNKRHRKATWIQPVPQLEFDPKTSVKRGHTLHHAATVIGWLFVFVNDLLLSAA